MSNSHEKENNITHIDEFLHPKIDTELPNGRIILDGGADLPQKVRRRPDDLTPPENNYDGTKDEE